MDIQGIDLNLLVTLDALLAEESVSRAAMRVHLSQPAVSAALARLRSLLSDPLLVRHGPGMVMTPYAETLKDPIRDILKDIDRTLTPPAPFDPATSTRTFRVATTDYTTFTVFPGLTRRVGDVAPNVCIELWPLDETTGERLAAGTLDLAIADDWSLRHLPRRKTLFTEQFVCLVRQDHPRIRRTLTLKRFLAERHALVSRRGRVPGNVDSVLAKTGSTRQIALTLPHFLAVPAIIAETDLLVTLAERIARRFAETGAVRVFKPPFGIPRFDVSMAWHQRMEGDAAMEWLTSLVRR